MAPTVQGTDTFSHNDFTVPGGASYSAITGSPAMSTSVVHAPETASLLIQTAGAAESVEHNITGSPTLPWHGFWFRVNAADEPATDFHVSRVNCADGNGGRIDFQVSSNKFFAYVTGGSEFPLSAAYTFDTWVWIESIVDCSSGTRTHYCRIGGVDLTPANRTLAASTGTKSSLGPTSADDTVTYYSNHKWGVAASVTDWLGEPATAETQSFYSTQRRRSSRRAARR